MFSDEVSSDDRAIEQASLAALFAIVAELPRGVRLRIALDVLSGLAEANATSREPRTNASRLRLESVSIGDDGTASVAADGELSGIVELVWEIVTGRPTHEWPLPRVGAIVDDLNDALDDVVASYANSESISVDAFSAAFENAVRDLLDPHGDVRAALGRCIRESIAPAALQHDEPRRSQRAPSNRFVAGSPAAKSVVSASSVDADVTDGERSSGDRFPTVPRLQRVRRVDGADAARPTEAADGEPRLIDMMAQSVVSGAARLRFAIEVLRGLADAYPTSDEPREPASHYRCFLQQLPAGRCLRNDSRDTNVYAWGTAGVRLHQRRARRSDVHVRWHRVRAVLLLGSRPDNRKRRRRRDEHDGERRRGRCDYHQRWRDRRCRSDGWRRCDGRGRCSRRCRRR